MSTFIKTTTPQESSKQSTNDSPDMTRRAIRGTLLTLVLRLVSFVCTQWTLRFIDNPTILGRANIQLELLLTTVLFVSREGFRLALTKNLDSDKTIWNVAWLSMPMSLIVSLLVMAWHWRSTATSSDYDYRVAGVLFCISCMVEGLAEPAVLHSLRQMNVATKASAEGMASVAKAMATVGLLQVLQDDWPVTAFGLAQLVYASVYFTILWRTAWNQVDRSQLLGPFHSGSCYMVAVFTLQGFFKHLLTEGDRLVLTTLSGAYDQGIYAMASAYGSLAARILLQPMEENARLLWSRLASSTDTSVAATRTLRDSYTNLVKLVMYIGFTFSCLAVNYTDILLAIMAGRKWGDNSEAAAVLSSFCVYTAFMALNGMTEAFVYSVASSGSDMGQLGAAHMAIGVVFAGVASFAVSRRGTVGLVAANCVAMSCRAIYSIVFAARYFATRQKQTTSKSMLGLIRDMLPHWIVLLCFAACYSTTTWSHTRMLDRVVEQHLVSASSGWLRVAGEHVVVGATSFLGLLSIAYYAEREFRSSLRQLGSRKND